MRVYITCPVSHSKKRLNILPIVEKIVKEQGLDTYVFEVGGSAKEIFNRDFRELKKCRLIIAEVSERSHGVGIEIGMSYCLELKRLLLIRKGEFVSKLAQGMPDTNIIEYKSTDDLKKKLNNELGKYKDVRLGV
jgi:hypothetical protein